MKDNYGWVSIISFFLINQRHVWVFWLTVAFLLGIRGSGKEKLQSADKS